MIPAIRVNAILYQNTPNPFTAQTEIRFSLPDDAPQAYIYIFDMTGKMQKQIPVDPDQQSVTINGYELSAGIYLYSLVVGGQEIDTKRMILSK
ncbi:MAG: T9SS type A sorting domain-containing protein [Bacteroidales bacterium]|nr:T9SS type A sorting domain-containing protein [Bacteroidales bacterium]